MPLTKPTTSSEPRGDKEATTREGFASYIRSEYSRRLDERRPFEQQWLINLAFIEGNQYVTLHKTTGEIFVPEKAYPWEQRDVFNQVAPVYETRWAKLSRNRSHMTVRPGSPEEDDINAAKVSARLLRYNVDEMNFDGIQAEAIAWSEATGTSFMKNLWNPHKGKVAPDPQGGESGVPLGDVETVVVNPFEILPDNILRSRLEDQGSIIHGKAWPLDSDHVQMLRELYRDTSGEDIQIQGEDVFAVTIGRGPAAMNGLPDLRFATKNLKHHCIVLEYYERPTRAHPKGRFAIVVNNYLIHYGDLPYSDMDFPFVKIDSIRRPNCFWSKSVIERIVPLQRRYNAVRNRIVEYLSRVGMGQWQAEEGTVDLNDLTNEPGLVIQYSRGARPPQPVAFPPLPGNFMQEVDTLQSEFMSVTGIHEVSHGQLPQNAGGSPSGVMVQQLQEQDDTRIAVAQRNLDEAVEKAGKQWLYRYKQFVNERRTFTVMGKNATVQLMAFDADDIRSYNVKVEASSALASTPGARRDMVFAMLDRGLFNDPQTGQLSPIGKQKVYEMLEFGNWEDFEEDKALPQQRAQWENHLMGMGQMIAVWPWEDHIMHIQIHRRFQQTEDLYELLATPEGQQIAGMVEQHVQEHLAHMTGAGPGAPPGAPPGAGPGAAQGPAPAAAPPGPPPQQPMQQPAQPQDPMQAIAAQAQQIEATKGRDAADKFVRDALSQLDQQMQGQLAPAM